MTFARAATRLSAVALLALSPLDAQPPVNAAKPRDAGAAEALYSLHCAACHGATLSGGPFGPALTGRAFAAKWGGRPAADLLSFITTAMPPGGVGTLPPGDYAQIAALLRARNSQGQGTVKTVSHPAAVGHVGPNPLDPSLYRDSAYQAAIRQRRAVLDRLTPVTEQMLAATPTSDWLSWRGSIGATGYSGLRMIDRASVGRLSVAWSWSLPQGVNEVAPLVHDGVLFLVSANEVQALDAANGDLLWRYRRSVEPQYRAPMTSMQKNIAIAGDALFVATSDRHLVALRLKTGELLWDTPVVPPDVPGVYLSAGPVVARGRVIQGVSGGVQCKGGCYIVGLDMRTGRQVWRFDTVARPGQPGGDSWNGTAVEDRRGGAVWVPGSFDPETGLVFFGVAGTYNAGSLLVPKPGRPLGDNRGLYTGATVALDAATGTLAWYHQHLVRDVWDLDEAFERTLLDIPVAGRPRKALMTVGKLGIVDVLDRRTGAYLFSRDLGYQNLVTAIDPRTGERRIDPARQPAAGKTSLICPSPEGVRNWMATAYAPASRTLYVPVTLACMDYGWHPAEATGAGEGGVKLFNANADAGSVDFGWTTRPRPGSDGRYGRLDAIDLTTRKLRWSRAFRAPASSAALATAGGVIFAGFRDRYFRAYSAEDGQELWRTRLSAVPNASPISFAAGGRQYVAVVAGGGAPNDFVTSALTPELSDAGPGTTLWVFGLPPEATTPPSRWPVAAGVIAVLIAAGFAGVLAIRRSA